MQWWLSGWPNAKLLRPSWKVSNMTKILVDLEVQDLEVANDIADRILTEIGGRPAEENEGVGIMIETQNRKELLLVESQIASIFRQMNVKIPVRRI